MRNPNYQTQEIQQSQDDDQTPVVDQEDIERDSVVVPSPVIEGEENLEVTSLQRGEELPASRAHVMANIIKTMEEEKKFNETEKHRVLEELARVKAHMAKIKEETAAIRFERQPFHHTNIVSIGSAISFGNNSSASVSYRGIPSVGHSVAPVIIRGNHTEITSVGSAISFGGNATLTIDHT
jgi:hypothetical protein